MEIRIFSKIAPAAQVIASTIQTVICESLNRLFTKISDLVHQFFHIKQQDKAKLLFANHKIPLSQHEWSLHKALLKDAYTRTNDPDLKRQIAFLCTNYLAIASPIHMNAMKLLLPGIEPLFQVNPSEHFQFHRFGMLDTLDFERTITRSFAMSQESPFIPTDTDDFEEMLPLGFTVLNLKNQADWEKIIKTTIKCHIASHQKNFLKNPLELGFLFDLTDFLKNYVQPKENEKIFRQEFKKIKAQIEVTYAKACHELALEGFEISEKKLKQFFHAQTTAICRVCHREKNVKGIKMLPLFASLKGNKLCKEHPSFLDFLSHTGLFVGAINFRRNWIDFFQEGKGIDYAVKSGACANGDDKRDVVFFKNKDSFMDLALIKRLFKKSAGNTFSAEINIFISSLLKMLDGLFTKEISEEVWNSLNALPGARRQILQTTLFKLREHLATAEIHALTKEHYLPKNFSAFCQAIELAYAELGVLLELTRPYKKGDFGAIFKEKLENLGLVPSSLQDHIIAGLGKTGVALFTTITVAARKHAEEFGYEVSSTYGKDFYYEQMAISGQNRIIDGILKDPEKAKKVSLYGAQISPNISVASNHPHYEASPVAEHIEALIKDRDWNQSPPLTVALDCTIDTIDSLRVKEILKKFEKETEEGKIQFFLFRSGQKLEMFGTDAYYGSIFTLINNGDPKWNTFKKVLQVEDIDSLSEQWFCLSNKYAIKELDDYKKLIFNNTREVLNNIPDSFKFDPKHPKRSITIGTADPKMDACFLDIKMRNGLQKIRAGLLTALFYRKFVEKGIKVHSRASFGYINPNISTFLVRAIPDATTVRLTAGINPNENRFIIDFFRDLAKQKPFFLS